MENITLESIKQWKENPTINPITNRKIKINGPTYKKLDNIYNLKIKNDNSQTEKEQNRKSKRTDKINIEPNKKKTKVTSKIKSKIDPCIIHNYIKFRKEKIDPILVISLTDKPIQELFSFPYQWNPYNGERLKELDPNGPLYFDPDSLVNYFYINRLNNLWNKAHIDQYSNYTQGYYGDGVGNGPDFFIASRGIHKDWYLFRLPIIDEYLRTDHCTQSVTMGPTLTYKEIKKIYSLSKKNNSNFKNTFGYARPNLLKIKHLYEQAISKNEQIDKILGDSLPNEEIKQIKYNTNIEAVNKLRNM